MIIPKKELLIQTVIHVTPKQHKFLKDSANENETSISKVVRFILDEKDSK